MTVGIKKEHTQLHLRWVKACLLVMMALSGTLAGVDVRCAFAGAWPMEKGKGQSITTLTWQSAIRGFDQQGKARVDLSFQKYENAIFIEYGLTDRWTIVARPAIQTVRLRTNNVVDEAKGFGATELSMRRWLGRWKKWVFSGQSGLFIPGSVENGFDKPLGQNGLDWEVRALAGRSIQVFNRPGFVDLQGAFRGRSRGSGNEIRLDSTMGAMLTQRIQVLVQSNVVIGLPSPRTEIRTVDSFKVLTSAVWYYREKTGLQLSVSRTLAGRNVVRDSGFTIGFWKKF